MPNSVSLERMVEQLRSQNHNDFSIKTTVVPDGTMQGQLIIEVQTKVGFRLLDLPPELRERIYGYVFAERKGYQIDIYSGSFSRKRGVERGPTESTKLVCGPNFRNRKTHMGQIWDHQTAKWIGGPPSGLSLLLVNKQIHHEAAPVAYRTNRFIFKNEVFSRVDRFVEVIGTSAKHLGEVEVQKVRGFKQLKQILGALENASGLHRLYLPERLVYREAKEAAKDPQDPESWACAFHKVIRLFLMELKKKYKASNRVWRVSDIVQFTRGTAWLNDMAGQSREDFEVFEGAFREIARAYLDEE